jgi:hypothetical protein
MKNYRITLALAVAAVLWTVHGTAQAQMPGSFGHYGTFSSSQGAPAQYSATAPGNYASGQYATVSQWYYAPASVEPRGAYPARMPENGPNPYTAGSVNANSANVYAPIRPSDNMKRGEPSNLYGAYGPSRAANPGPPRPVNANAATQDQWRREMARYNYDRGFRDGYNANLTLPTTTRIQTTAPPNPFASY